MADTVTAVDAAQATIDPQRQERAKTYAGIRRRLSLVDLGLGAAYLAVILGLGLALRLRDAFAGNGTVQWMPVSGWSPILVAVTAFILLAVYGIISLPLSIYAGYMLPRRFGLNTQKFSGWLGDQAKSQVLGFVFAIALIELLYLLLAVQPLTWWLWLAGILLLFSVVLVNLAPVLLLPLFYKRTALPDGALRQSLLAMAERAHTHVEGVYTINMSSKTTEGNAALMGLGNTRCIVISDTMLRDYTPGEVEVVLAHELGHQVHQDIWKGIVVNTIVTLAGFGLVNLGLRAAIDQPIFGLHGLTDVATMPVLALVLGLYGLVSGPLSNTYSRIVERQADQYALDTTKDPTNFISAFNRLANQNLAQLDPNPIIEALFYDHPAIGKRIRHAETWRASLR